jgi:hypothetical protein
VSCRIVSIPPLAKSTPVTPPTVNKKINPLLHRIPGVNIGLPPNIVANQLKTLIPVGTAIIMVADVK